MNPILRVFLLLATLTTSRAATTEPEVSVALISDVSAMAPGQPFTVALQFQHTAEWHTYWINSGGVEEPAKIQWKLPPSFIAGPLEFQVPERIEHDGRVSYVYSGTSYLLTQITPPLGLAPGSEISISGDLTYQYCKEVCKQGKINLTVKLPVAMVSIPHPENAAPLAACREAHFPKPLPPDWKVTATRLGGKVILTVPEAAIALGDPHFFSADKHLLSGPGSLQQKSAGKISLAIPHDPTVKGPFKSLSGLLVLPSAAGGKEQVGYRVEVPVSLGIASDVSGNSLAYTLLLAFVGGLILNLMPCVFPVIGLKIMGFVRQAGQDRKKILMHGFVFSAGVLICFWVLSGTLLWLRSKASKWAGVINCRAPGWSMA